MSMYIRTIGNGQCLRFLSKGSKLSEKGFNSFGLLNASQKLKTSPLTTGTLL
jgi:hypothetical protein